MGKRKTPPAPTARTVSRETEIRDIMEYIANTDAKMHRFGRKAKTEYLAWRASQMEFVNSSPVPEVKKTLDLFPLEPSFNIVDLESPIKDDHVDPKPDLAPIPPNLIAPCGGQSSVARKRDGAVAIEISDSDSDSNSLSGSSSRTLNLFPVDSEAPLATGIGNRKNSKKRKT